MNESPLPHEPIICQGVIHGQTITLDALPPGLADGQRVVVHVESPKPFSARSGEPRAGAGSWADAGPELDEWLKDVYAARNLRSEAVE